MNPNYLYDLVRQQPLRSDLMDPVGIPQTLSGMIAMENARNYAPTHFNFTPEMARGFDQQAAQGQADLSKFATDVQNQRFKNIEVQNRQLDNQIKQAQLNELRGLDVTGKPINLSIEQANAKFLERKYGKAPANYRWKNDGTLEAIPGGPGDIGKALPTPAIDKLSAAGTAVEDTRRLTGSFKTEYGGKTILGDLSNTYKRIMGDETGQAQWWQDMDALQNQTRHNLFGSALTATELKAWEKTSISPRMDADQIQQNLKRRQEIEARAASKLARAYAAGGYNKEQIKELLGIGADYIENPAKPVAPIGGQNLSSQDMQALDWAMKNRSDPRAQQIMQKLGIQ